MATPQTPRALQGRFELLELLGRGGQGSTWRAKRLDQEGPDVAIKMMHLAELTRWKALELFQREAEVLRGLDTQGVPRFYELIEPEDEDQAPTFCLVQELIEGVSLEERMNEGKHFDDDEVTNILWQLAQILSDLHHKQPPIIHRDIKPANILVNQEGRCFLIDFGAVRHRANKEGGSTVAGTYGYMAPEVYQGKAAPGSDLYSLGACALHLLTKVPPSEMEVSHFRLDFEPHLSTGCRLKGVLSKLLEPELEHRLSDADALARALEALDLDLGVEEEDALPVVTKVKELVALGQAGGMTLFEALPPAPRKTPKGYLAPFFKKVIVYLGVSALIAGLLMSGLLTLFGLYGAELFMVVALPFILFSGLLSSRRRLKKLLRKGRKAMGHISDLRSGRAGVWVRYQFPANGESVEGEVCLKGVGVELELGERIGILYLEEDPCQNVPYPLPPGALVNLFEEDC